MVVEFLPQRIYSKLYSQISPLLYWFIKLIPPTLISEYYTYIDIDMQSLLMHGKATHGYHYSKS